MLLSLLSSEAMVDSRDYEILNAEELEELVKVSPIFFIDIKLRSALPRDIRSSVSPESMVTVAIPSQLTPSQALP